MPRKCRGDWCRNCSVTISVVQQLFLQTFATSSTEVSWHIPRQTSKRFCNHPIFDVINGLSIVFACLDKLLLKDDHCRLTLASYQPLSEHFVSLGLVILPVVSYSSQTFRIFKPRLLFSNDRFIVPVVLFMLYLLSDHHLPFLHLLLFNNSPFDSHYLFTARRHHRDVVFHLHLSPEQQTKRH